MRRIIEYFVQYPIMANIIIAITLLGGVLTLVNTNKSFFPSRNPNSISIQVAYPGASPEEMEEGVTLKVEEAIKSIVGIDELHSKSSENFASITVTTRTDYDIDEVYTEIKNTIDGINSFPVSAEKPRIFKQKPQTTAMWLALKGDVDLLTLKDYGEQIEEELINTGVISQVNVSGFNSREISIEVSEQDLSRYNLTFDEVTQAVRVNNRDISAGAIKSTREEILIRSNAKETDTRYIAEIVLRSNPDGTKLLLKDVATVKEQWTDNPNTWTINGSQAVFLEVKRLEDEDLQAISDYVSNYVTVFNETHTGVELVNAYDFYQYLTQRIDMLTTNGMLGLFLVLVALGTFLSMRLSFWVAWGIPSSFLGMFIIGSFFGLTINMISLFGMILVIGILVDDGIVIAENIFAHFEKHGNARKAAVEGTMEVLPAVLASVLTTIIAFSPLLILEGGFEFLKDMGFVVIASLSFSLFEAFFVLPAHLASKSVLKIHKEDTRSYKIRKFLNGIIDWMRYKVYGNALKYTMKFRWASFSLLIGIFIIMVGLFQGGLIKSTFFPNIPFTVFSINVTFKPGTPEDVVIDHLKEFEKGVWELNDELKAELGKGDIFNFSFSGTGSTMDGSDQGAHAGGIQIFYEDLDDKGIDSYELIKRLKKKIGEVPEAEKFTIGGQERFGKAVYVRLLGEDIAQLNEAKAYLKNELNKIEELKEVQDNVDLGKREMQFTLTPQAYFMGLTHDQITKQVRQGFFGEEVQRLQKGRDEVRVWVRYPGSGRISIGQLEDMKIKTAKGEEFPLTELAGYELERSIAGIRHYSGTRVISVFADMVDPYAEVPPVMAKVKDEIVPQMKVNFPLVSVDYGGQSKESAKAQAQIGLYFGAAFVLIFFILMITFKSFYQAVLIMFMIPLGWIGASIGHGLEGFPVSLLSAWGMIALSGVIINDAVVFLSKFNTLLKEGMSTYQAAYNAGLARFRPIILTSITTVLGLYPLIKETSFQAQFLIPMAISVAYGVLIGTFFILLFFPVLIIIFNDVRRAAKWFWTGKKPSAEDVERVLIDEKRMEEYKKIA